MSEPMNTADFLTACSIDPDVIELRPDYRALLLIVDGLDPEAHQAAAGALADELITAAEAHAQTLLAESPVDSLPHISAWRQAYRAFGAKPQRTRNSLEALTRRAEAGLPRVNALTDIYNAISVLHQVPLGGEDLDAYQGPARLVRATGDEPFDTMAGGQAVIDYPSPGEVVWRDDAGVTCRRWNWRQARRTGLTEGTRRALFILDALSPMTDEELEATASALALALSALGSAVDVTQHRVGTP